MTGLIKTYRGIRYQVIGAALLQAEQMVYMCPFHQSNVLISQNTQKAVCEIFYTKAIMMLPGAETVYEVLPSHPEKEDNNTKEYNKVFAFLKKGKISEAIKVLTTFLDKGCNKGDKSAKFLLERLKIKVEDPANDTVYHGL